MRVQKYLTPTVLQFCSPLVDLNTVLSQMQVGAPDQTKSYSLLIESEPEIRDEMIHQFKGEDQNIIQNFAYAQKFNRSLNNGSIHFENTEKAIGKQSLKNAGLHLSCATWIQAGSRAFPARKKRERLFLAHLIQSTRIARSF